VKPSIGEFSLTYSMDSIMHNHQRSNLSSNRLNALLQWLKGTSVSDENMPVTDDPLPPESEIRIDPPGQSSWGESLKTAITDATSLFIQRHVQPYHVEDPCITYSVHRLKVGHNEAAALVVRDWLAMRQDMRDGISKIRIEKAKDAHVQIDLSGYYGISFHADDTLVDGQLVETIVYNGGARIKLQFEFEGEYITRPAPVHRVHEEVVVKKDADESVQSTSEIGTGTQASLAEPEKVPPNDHLAVQKLTERTMEANADTVKTPMRTQPPVKNNETADIKTPMRVIRQVDCRLPIARLHMRYGNQTALVDLFQDGFPYSIGRHHASNPTQPGFAVLSKHDNAGTTQPLLQSIASTQVCYTSREHLLLQQWDSATGDVRVDNLSAQKGSNGTWQSGQQLGQRFVYSTGQSQWLQLGDPQGGGILEIKIEKI
jgi:hypothetical protein